jgi:hypothetical protein
MRPARPVEVDPSRAAGERLPVTGEIRGFEFGEAGVTEIDGVRVHGVLGWDPRLGWVLIADEAGALAELLATRRGGVPDDALQDDN